MGATIKKFSIRFLSIGLFLFVGCAAIDKAISPKPRASETASPVLKKIDSLASRWNVEPIPVGLKRQVFYDNALISSMSTTMVRRWGQAVKLNDGNPVIAQDKSWESTYGNWGVGLYFSVLTNEDGSFQCWYSYGKNDQVGYATSKDGIHWEKPRMGLGMDNQVLYPACGPCVMYDPHDTRSGHRYKAIYGVRGRLASQNDVGVVFAHSSHGRSWSIYEDTEILDSCRSDTGNAIMWDDELECYRISARAADFTLGRGNKQYVRPYVDSGMLAFVETLLFVPTQVERWTCVEEWRLPNESGGSIYSCFIQKYGDIYIGYINFFHGGTQKDHGLTLDDKIDGDVNDFYVVTSRNGIHWNTESIYAKQPLIERGPAGSFDQNGIWPPSSPLITVGDKQLIYYCGRWTRHSKATPGMKIDGKAWYPPKPRSAIGVAEIRLDGLIYLENTNDVGVVETKAFDLQGNRLEVNCDATSGELRVEILDKQGQVMPGFNAEQCDVVHSDSVHQKITWHDSDLSGLKGQTIKLRFSLKNHVKLYAFQVFPEKK